MGESRSCDARCHNAKGPHCACWCGGLFHGAAGKAAREAFVDAFNETPKSPEQFDSLTTSPGLFDVDPNIGARWRAAVAAARAARETSS